MVRELESSSYRAMSARLRVLIFVLRETLKKKKRERETLKVFEQENISFCIGNSIQNINISFGRI